MSYKVVLLDGKELQNLSLQEVKDLFFKRQINQTSLICSDENPQWQMLKRAFDVLQWMPASVPQTPPPSNHQNAFQPQNNPFEQPNQAQSNAFQAQSNHIEQPNPANQPIIFNQFPPHQNSSPNNNFAPNTSNGYSQNNQSETYYQAETNQSQYNFQNKQKNFASSNYNNPANNNNFSQSNNFSPISDYAINERNGLRPAAVFLVINALFNIVFVVLTNLTSTTASTQSSSYNSGRYTGFIVPLIIDLLLAIKLWSNNDAESARKWVLARTYFGFLIFGIIVPVFSAGTNGIAVGVISFGVYFVLFISVLLVLHGKQGPSPTRVMVGIGTFAVYFLLMIGTLGLTSLSMLAPNLAKMDLSKGQFEKYKIEGKEFEDKTTGAKVVLPEGWIMLDLNNPIIHTPEARMIAVDEPGNRLTMLEVVPVPANLDMKQANSAFVLDQLANSVVESLKKEAESGGGFKKNSFREVARLNIYIGKHPARLLVFDKTEDGEKIKGHLIITFDELTFYVLHSWCPASEYDTAQNDFTFFEKNFIVPEKINSPFTQSADNEKNKSNPKKNY